MIRDELFDADWRWKSIKGEMARVDDADAVPEREPQSTICCLSDRWSKAGWIGDRGNSIGNAEDRGLDCFRADMLIYSGRPIVKLRASYSYQTTRRVHP